MEKKKNFPSIPSTLSLDDLLEVKGGGDGITVECKVPGSGICLVVGSGVINPPDPNPGGGPVKN